MSELLDRVAEEVRKRAPVAILDLRDNIQEAINVCLEENKDAEEPKMRPWTRDEFPHWCALRRKQGDKNDLFKDSIQFATTLVPEGCYIARSSAPYTWQYLLESYEHSTDGAKTWHPCGVMEGGAK